MPKPSDAVIFPYGVRLKEGGAIDTLPVAKIALPDKNGEWLSLFLVIDSGATLSALPASDASMLGIRLEDGEAVSISGIDGQLMTGWIHRIKARLGKRELVFPAALLENSYAPRILGRLGVFDQFTIVFEEKNKRTGLLGNNSPQARQTKRLLDKLLQ